MQRNVNKQGYKKKKSDLFHLDSPGFNDSNESYRTCAPGATQLKLVSEDFFRSTGDRHEEELFISNELQNLSRRSWQIRKPLLVEGSEGEVEMKSSRFGIKPRNRPLATGKLGF